MEFQSAQNDKIAQLTSILAEIMAERDSQHPATTSASKMSFSTSKQPLSSSKDAFARFYAFEESVMDLQRTLQDFSNTVQHLGSSVGVIASAYHIRFRLDGILRLFRGNVSKVHPEHTLKLPPTRHLVDPPPRHKGDLVHVFSLVDTSTQALPDECVRLTRDLDIFLQRIREIPDFTDDIVAELLGSTIRTLSAHMAEWMKSLAEFENLDWPDVRRFLDELSSEMQLDIERLSRSLGSFVTVGIPMIEHAQKRKGNALLNISTVATFFSGVTATALQYSLASNGSAVEQMVNFSWTSALIFSLGSAIDSQLAYRWQVAAHSSPDPLVPAWLSRWLTDAPLLLLVLSAALFIVGLVCFSFSAFGGSFIPITTSVFAGLLSLGIIVVGMWIIGEELTFSKTQGHHWFLEILLNPKAAFGEHFSWVRAAFPIFFEYEGHERFAWIRRHWRRFLHSLSSSLSLLVGWLLRPTRMPSRPEGTAASVPRLFTEEPGDEEKGLRAQNLPAVSAAGSLFQSPPPTPQRPTTPLPDVSYTETRTTTLDSGSTLLSPSTPVRARSSAPGAKTDSTGESFSTKKRNGPPRSNNKPRGRQHRNLHTWRHADMLHSLRNITHHAELSDIEVPYPRVMAFSPLGSYFAALCPNQKIRIWETGTGAGGSGGSGLTEVAELSPKDGALQEILWMPIMPKGGDIKASFMEEKYLLLRYKNRATIRLMRTTSATSPSENSLVWYRSKTAEITSMCWLREKPCFLWSEGSVVWLGRVDFSHNRQAGAPHEKFFDFQTILDRVDPRTTTLENDWSLQVVINDMLVIPGDRLLILTVCLAPDVGSDDFASKNPEHRVIVFNMEKMEIETFFATFDDVGQISIYKSGMFIVISRKSSPPTVYELKNLSQPSKRAWLDPILVCEAPPELSFIGQSFLASVLPEGGQTVMTSTRDGVMHVWDRKFGTKLGELVPDDAIPGQVVDTIAWTQEQALLAIAYHKGSIRLSQVKALSTGQEDPERTGGGGGGGGGKGESGHRRSVSGIGATG